MKKQFFTTSFIASFLLSPSSSLPPIERRNMKTLILLLINFLLIYSVTGDDGERLKCYIGLYSKTDVIQMHCNYGLRGRIE